MLKRVMSRFSVKFFLSSSTETFRRGTLLCFRKFPVAKTFMDKRGGVSRFFVENFLSHSAEIFVKEPFSASLISGI